ncbi:MAG: proline--tRNA ligase [Bdellovibrionales bacterium]
MKWSKSHLFTVREAPNDAEIASHKLMVRAGLIKKLGPGIYTYGTLALKALRKVENIIRQELEDRDCQELLMPMVHPKEVWTETGRWEAMGDGLLKFQNRNSQWYCLGATHEEVITDYIRNDLKSYKSLPVTLFQVQTKYRDEIRPRFGLMRCREFLMKDAYSFDADKEAAIESYERLYEAYEAIYDRIGLEYRIVEADAGNIGGSLTHEFQVLAESGEDSLMVCDSCDYAANVEIAPVVAVAESFGDNDALKPEEFSTPDLKTIKDLSKATSIEEKYLVKSIFVKDEESKKYLVLLRGDDELNEIKLKNCLGLENPPEMLLDEEVKALTGALPGSCGPVGLDIPIYADNELKNYKNFIVGANIDDKHLKNVNFNKDFELSSFADLRIAKIGDSCPKCESSSYKSIRGIEVGHCFYLGTKYSSAMNAIFLDKNGKTQPIEMGCYGIGVSRTVQSAIEQSHDENGIIWPKSIAPFDLHICLLDPKDEEASQIAQSLYKEAKEKGMEALLDDRKERPGVKFKDADLIGLPLRVVIGGKGIKNNELEIVERASGKKHLSTTAELNNTVFKVLETI